MTLAAVHPITPTRGLTSIQGTLALEILPRLDPPQPDLRRPSSRPGTEAGDLVHVEQDLRRDTEQWIARYLQAAVEIVQGDRPPHQLARHTDPEVHRDLIRRCALVSEAAGRESGSGRTPHSARPAVLRVHTSHVRRGTVEAMAHVRHGQRHRAVAACFELRRARWVCVAIEFA